MTSMLYGGSRNGRSYGNFAGKLIVKGRYEELCAMTKEQLVLAMPESNLAEVRAIHALLRGEDPKDCGIIVMDPYTMKVEQPAEHIDLSFIVERSP